jgi:hypothetical protein
MPQRVHIFQKTVRGKKRQLIEAREDLRSYHQLIQDRILSKLPLADSIHGYRRGRSNVTHARRHSGAAVVLRFDIQDFFPSIKVPRVNKFFRNLGAGPESAELLARLTTFQGFLPIGFSTSPTIANHVVAKLVRRLEILARKERLSFSVYADNFEIAGTPRVEGFRTLIASIFSQEGFILNEGKSVVLRGKTRKEITGVVVNSSPSWGRDRVRGMRARIHTLRYKGLPLDYGERTVLLNQLRGYAAYVKSINSKQGEDIHRWIKTLEAPAH